LAATWYTNDKHIEEFMVYVDPRHRRSSHAKALVSWMKSQVRTDWPAIDYWYTIDPSTEAKVRLYERMLPKIGAFFYIAPKGK